MYGFLIFLTPLAWGLTAAAGAACPPAPPGRPIAPAANRPAPAAPPVPTYRITPDTEVFLDGRARPFKEVPAEARIDFLEVTPDNRIQRAFFRSP